VTDETGHTWRVAESERPDADYVTRYRAPGEDDWTDRYVFRRVPRERAYFAPTCEFLATAPESPFTVGPTVSIGTEEGHLRLDKDSFERLVGGEVVAEQPVTADNWHDILREQFGIDLEAA
jgi:N-hydroxyarylamine O-acetyltransferase